MIRLSKRLEVLASFISNEDSLVDVGCDHGYLSIYLKKNNKCKRVICSDINQNALDSAIKNIKDSNLQIDCYLSDGLKDIPMNNIDTILIAGMGSSTIIDILKNKDKLSSVKKIVLQSNNNHEELRRFMNDIGYYLEREEFVFDKGKWYVMMLYSKSNKKNSDSEIKYGYINKDYGLYLLNTYQELLKKIPSDNDDYLKYEKKMKEIKTIIK